MGAQSTSRRNAYAMYSIGAQRHAQRPWQRHCRCRRTISGMPTLSRPSAGIKHHRTVSSSPGIPAHHSKESSRLRERHCARRRIACRTEVHLWKHLTWACPGVPRNEHPQVRCLRSPRRGLLPINATCCRYSAYGGGCPRAIIVRIYAELLLCHCTARVILSAHILRCGLESRLS